MKRFSLLAALLFGLACLSSTAFACPKDGDDEDTSFCPKDGDDDETSFCPKDGDDDDPKS